MLRYMNVRIHLLFCKSDETRRAGIFTLLLLCSDTPSSRSPFAIFFFVSFLFSHVRAA